MPMIADLFRRSSTYRGGMSTDHRRSGGELWRMAELGRLWRRRALDRGARGRRATSTRGACSAWSPAPSCTRAPPCSASRPPCAPGSGWSATSARRAPADFVLRRRPEVVTAPGRVQAWLIGSGMDADSRPAGRRDAAARGARRRHAARDRRRRARPGRTGDRPGRHHAALPRAGDGAGRGGRRRLGRRHRRRHRGGPGAVGGARGRTPRRHGAAQGAHDLRRRHRRARGSRSTAGPAWLATAGSGDVLGGVLGALLATHAREIGDGRRIGRSPRSRRRPPSCTAGRGSAPPRAARSRRSTSPRRCPATVARAARRTASDRADRRPDVHDASATMGAMGIEPAPARGAGDAGADAPALRRVLASRSRCGSRSSLVHLVLGCLAPRPDGEAPRRRLPRLQAVGAAGGAGHARSSGIQSDWVYPFGAIVPIMLPLLFGADNYIGGWLTHGAAARRRPRSPCSSSAASRRRSSPPGGGSAFLLLLGPIADRPARRRLGVRSRSSGCSG